MASLATAIEAHEPVPLEGLDPYALLRTVRVAMADGLFDDLDFLPGPAQAAALYELAAALPASWEKRHLGRQVYRSLQRGNAPTFVALATQIARGSRRGLSGPEIRARVALCLDLPLGYRVSADALALALISRRELANEWLEQPSTGSLPARRLAARLLERAAREAARRYAQGDDGGLRVFDLRPIRHAWDRLLADRESLVWRHVANARGLLTEARPYFDEQITIGLDVDRSPTEWRRAATSLSARLAVAPETSERWIRELLGSPIAAKDPGAIAALAWGFPRAVEVEPARVRELLPPIVLRGGLSALEAVVELQREHAEPWLTDLVRPLAIELMEQGRKSGETDDGWMDLAAALDAELDDNSGTLPARVSHAVTVFAEDGASAAYRASQALVDAAESTLATLLFSRDDSEGRSNAVRALRDLDAALLASSTLADLVELGSDDRRSRATLATVIGQLHDWLLTKEEEPIRTGGFVQHLTLRQRRCQTLLHAVDSTHDGQAKDGEVHSRRLRSTRVLLGRVHFDAPGPMCRVITAGAARALDALVRDETCSVGDAVLLAADNAKSVKDLVAFAEATTIPETKKALFAYLDLGRQLEAPEQGGAHDRATIDALARFANALPVASSIRVDALRTALSDLARHLEAVSAAISLSSLADDTSATLISPIIHCTRTIAQLTTGARRRIGHHLSFEESAACVMLQDLEVALERILRGQEGDLAKPLALAINALRKEMAPYLADAIANALRRLEQLPIDSSRRFRSSFRALAPKEAPLPAWLPPSRALGGFFVVRSLSAGAVGSVFVARRLEQRHDARAQRFALKVPDYNGAAARTLSESEFFALFRSEAGTLIQLPSHPNLANFVTFDAGARPKPILVMELVEGPTLQKAIDTGDLSLERAVDILVGVADGLCAMHDAGIGHLDIKPSNVILREGSDGNAPTTPVLVDFGLSGRHVRPGCATAEYGAPEVWTLQNTTRTASPQAADVYSFGCLAYEVLTGKPLFEGPNELSLIAQHIGHDGGPDKINKLLNKGSTHELGELLRETLRQEASDRPLLGEVCSSLKGLATAAANTPWPIGLPSPQSAVAAPS